MDVYERIEELLAGLRAFDLLVKSSISPTPFLTELFGIITQAGSGAFLGLLALFLLILSMRKRQLAAGLTMAAGLCVIYLLVDAAKELMQRSRPFGKVLTWAPGYSFPSGHSACSMFVYGFLIYWIFRQDWPWFSKYLSAAFGGLLIVLIGFSRIYLNAHYASDVLAGYILGIIGVVAAVKVSQHWEKS